MGDIIAFDLTALHFEFTPVDSQDRRCPRRRRLLSPTRPSETTLPSITASISSRAAQTQLAQPSNPSITSQITSPPHAATIVLPFGTARGPHSRQYLWDGHRLVAVDPRDMDSVQEALKSSYPGALRVPSVGAIHAAAAKCTRDLRDAFFPSPDGVTPDYWKWCQWRAVHRLFSSMASVFATQSLLLAVGVGAKRTLPAAAAINWVLKDGLGRLGRLTVATRFGESFDSDLKRFRFSSSLLYAGALSLDYLTPLFPQHFLVMAALANVGKSVGLTTYISTQPAFHRSFALSENLADISAKSQAQQMAVDTVGLALAVGLSALCARHSDAARRRLPLLALPWLAGGDIFAIHNELRSIHLRTLNKERAEIIAGLWLAKKKAPSPLEVSAQERLVVPPEADLGPLPLTIGALEEVLRSEEEVRKFVGEQGGSRRNQHQRYAFAVLEGKERRKKGGIRAALRADATADDVIEVVLRAAHLRQTAASSNGQSGGSGGKRAVFVSGGDEENAAAAAKKEVQAFVRDLEAAGWQVSPFMLSSAERRYFAEMA